MYNVNASVLEKSESALYSINISLMLVLLRKQTERSCIENKKARGNDYKHSVTMIQVDVYVCIFAFLSCGPDCSVHTKISP